MLKAVDVLLLYAADLLQRDDHEKLRANVGPLLSAAQLRASDQRTREAGLRLPVSSRVSRHALDRLMIVGARALFPPQFTGDVDAGVPTAVSCPVFSEVLRAGGTERIVWPSRSGTQRGRGLKPIHPVVLRTYAIDQRLYHAMALIDSLRMGGARERNAAARLLVELRR